jgi:HSP20 family protein
MEDLQNRLAPWFGRLSLRGTGDETMTTSAWAPLVDITEDDKEYLIKAELPEVKEEDVKVTIENGTLSISGHRRFETEKDKNIIGLSDPTARLFEASRCPRGRTPPR